MMGKSKESNSRMAFPLTDCSTHVSAPLPPPPPPVPVPPSHQACRIPDTVVFSLAPCEEHSSLPCSVPYWDLLQTSVPGTVDSPLPLRNMLFSLLPQRQGAAAAWSLPAAVRADFPRQSVSVPGEADSEGGPSSRWVNQSFCGLLAVTLHLEQGTRADLAQVFKRGGAVCGHS